MFGYYRHPYMHEAIWITVSLLFLSISIGYFLVSSVPDIGNHIGDPEEKVLLFKEGTPGWIFTVQLYLNNVKICLMAFLGGFLLGIGPILVIIMNGLFLGITFRYLAHQGVSFFLSVFPHLGFELAGFVLAAALGMMAGQNSWDYVLNKPDKKISTKNLIFTFLIWTNMLLIIGALVETYISSFIANLIVQ